MTAASAVAPVIEAAAAQACVDLVLMTEDTAAAGAALADGEIDVWVPDSQVRAIAAGAGTANAPSVALSPLVLAADADTAAAIAPEGATSWGVVLGRAQGDLDLQIQDPATSSAGLLLAQTLVPVAEAATGDTYIGYTAVAATLTSVPRFEGTMAPGSVAVLESRLVPDGATVVPTMEGYPALDYPWIQAADSSAETSAAAAAVLDSLHGDDAAQARSDAGLIEPDATEFTENGVAAPLLPGPALEEMPLLYALADAGGARGYGLSVVDISGSMGLSDSDGGPARIEVVQQSARLAVEVLADDTEMGLWVFGYNIDGNADHLQVVARGPMSTNRAAIVAAIAQYTPEQLRDEDYGTALYDTVHDAYADAVKHWQPNRNNLIAVFTDGTDEDAPGGLSLAELESALADLGDPERPVQVMLFGYGEADIDALQRIADATSGTVYPITQPEQIVGAFIDSIAKSVLAGMQAAA